MQNDPAYQSIYEASEAKRMLLLGATGTIGSAVLDSLLAQGHTVKALVRDSAKCVKNHPALEVVQGDFSDQEFLIKHAKTSDAVISCIASRTGVGEDAWAVDYGLNHALLQVAKETKLEHFVLLSAICVQRPLLEFQKAKAAFEEELKSSGLTYTIVRPTAFFKSLSGQLDRLRAGKPFLMFGNGEITSCKPISDEDLAHFITTCLSNPSCANRVLPVGGPGPALTPHEQGQQLAEALGVPFQSRSVPPGFLNLIATALSFAGLVSRKAREKAELARIGHYYATQSMLVWDEVSNRYDAERTPEFGTDTLQVYYRKLAAGEVTLDRGDHAVF